MVKTTVYLDQDVAIRLRQLAESEGRTRAEIVREAVCRYTGAAKRPMPPGIGRYSSGRSDISERAEEILNDAAARKKWD